MQTPAGLGASSVVVSQPSSEYGHCTLVSGVPSDPQDRASRLARWLVRHRSLVLVLASLIAVVGLWQTVATYGALRSELEELLPTTAPSVLAFDQARARLPGLRTLGVVVDTGGPQHVEAANRFADALADRVRSYPPGMVTSVQVDITTERRFAETYALQLMDLEDLTKLRKAVEERRDWEVSRATGMNVLDEEDQPPKVPVEELRDKYQKRFGPPRKSPSDRFVSEDGHTVVLLIRSSSQTTGYEADAELMRRVKADIASLDFPNAYAAGMRAGFAGDVPTQVEEMEGLVVDLGVSGLIVVLLTLGVIIGYFRSWRALVIIVLPLLYGAFATFGVVALPPLSIRHLNSNTAFLGSIIVGNGINSGIMLLARFREERILGRDLVQAISTMVSTTWRPTLAAAGAAAAAYGSLVFTDFRGFAQFGWIGGIGMLVCWSSAVLLIPVMASWLGEKMPASEASRHHAGLGAARLLFRHPVAVLLTVALLAAVAVVGLVRHPGDWIEYDLSKLRRGDAWSSGERYWGQRMDATMGRFLTPTVVMATDGRDAAIIAGRLREIMDQNRAGGVIASVHSADDLLPPDRGERVTEARAIAKALTPRIKQTLTPRQREIVERAVSPEALEPLTAERVPDTLAAGLRERDGRMDRHVLVFPKPGSTWNAVRLEPFAKDVREAATVDGRAATVTGSLVLSSDIAAAMKRDGPRTTALSFLAVTIICIIAFRSFKASAAALVSLCAGVVMMLGAMAWASQKLNFSNFVALPITFGIAADYSINVLKRYQQEGRIDLESALSATGGAVALCSATTIIGYGSLLMAENQALFSFGLFAVTGELTCLGTALLALPAVLSLRRRAKKR